MTVTDSILIFLFLISLILVIARIFGAIGRRFFGFPAVIGELMTGIVIGPYALGSVMILGFSLLPHIQTGMFAPVSSSIPIPQVLYMFAQTGAIILLFNVGLETDPEKFVKSSKLSFAIAFGGVILPFMLGYMFILWYDKNVVNALFMGAILTATSVGITARVLKDLKRSESREGIVILVAAVIDDVFGIVVLAIVAGIVSNKINLISIILTIIKITVFWIVVVVIGLKFHKQISRVIGVFEDHLTQFAIVLMFLFVISVISEALGMTIIIGAYAFGLALSKVSMKNQIEKDLRGLYSFFVPIFFVTMGMMVDVNSFIGTGLFISIIIIVAAIIGKVFGAAIPALFGGFDLRKSVIIGTGMIPRGEVALIIAGYAILYGLITRDMYDLAILVTIVTTLLAPIFLAKLYSKTNTSYRKLI